MKKNEAKKYLVNGAFVKKHEYEAYLAEAKTYEKGKPLVESEEFFKTISIGVVSNGWSGEIKPISPDEVKAVTERIHNTVNGHLLQSITIMGRVFTIANCKFLEDVFRSKITSLDLTQCIFKTEELVSKLCSLILENNTIQCLCLPNFPLDDFLKIMASISRNKCLKRFFPRGKCRGEDLPIYIDTFTRNKSIEELALAFHGVGNVGNNNNDNEFRLDWLNDFFHQVLANRTCYLTSVLATVQIGEDLPSKRFINNLASLMSNATNKFRFNPIKWGSAECKSIYLKALEKNKQYRSVYWVWLIIRKGKHSKVLVEHSSEIGRILIRFLGNKIDDY